MPGDEAGPPTGGPGTGSPGGDLASEELLHAVRLVRRGAGRPALLAALDWDDRLYTQALEVVAERFDVPEQDVRLLTAAITAIRSYGLDARVVVAFTDPAVSDRAVVACWSAGLSGEEIEQLARSGAAVDEATLATLAALRGRWRR